MAKVKTSSPKKRGRAANKTATGDDASTTEQTSKSKASKKIPLQTRAVNSHNNDIDSDISSSEKPTRKTNKRASSSSSTISKISQKSKATNSKWRPTKLKDIDWLKGLLQMDVTSKWKRQQSQMGVEVRYPSSLSLRIEDGIQYVTYPWNNGKCSGYVKVVRDCEKLPKVPTSSMKLTVLLGKIDLITGKDSTPYKAGTVISIPKGVKYGLRNNYKDTCFIRFQTMATNE
ncbi:uncharacterized protein LOC116341267 [Contarinia nasturtii]|uniref:uncharacterized protein LOC116341267 n=1 Tax=Contarinia nasturtii TaxID=265458 RepID=UPI0012D47A90|nr:uncharacterized protein LOC116341267 [Contarinia nasturtii]